MTAQKSLKTPPFEPVCVPETGSEAHGLLARYLEHLLHTNQTLNLTTITDPALAWKRHILESVALAPPLQGASRILDLGSGGGLPGIPLAIVLPHAAFTLLESTGKKARFLQETCALLNLRHVTVCPRRAEEIGHHPEHRAQYDAVTCRAVGGLSEIMELALPLLRIQGVLLAVKGRRADEEIADAQTAFEELGCTLRARHPLLPDEPDNDSVLLHIEKIAPTHPRYPRTPGTPKKNPLRNLSLDKK